MLGVAQLGKIDRFIEMKRQVAGWYGGYLGELSRQGLVQLPPEMPWAKSVYWIYSILLGEGFALSRSKSYRGVERKGNRDKAIFLSCTFHAYVSN